MSEAYEPILRTLPAPWEREETFHEHLYEWMERAPWLALSAAAHLVVFLIIQAIPWTLFEKQHGDVLIVSVPPLIEEFIEEPPEPPLEILDEIIDDVQPVDIVTPVSDMEENPNFFDDLEAGDPSDSPFDLPPIEFKSVELGIGGGSGGKYEGRFTGPGDGGGGGKPYATEVDRGLDWLARHQSADGHWDVDEFMHDNAMGGSACDGAGSASQDIGVTALALLAFLGDGHTTSRGRYRGEVARGLRWLIDWQDPETGLVGEQIGHTFLYDHALATLALCEASLFSKSNPLLRRSAQKAVNLCSRARNPYGAWRYDLPPVGDNDTSITGWMVFALKSAEEAGLEVDREAYAGALAWFDEVTDPASGRCGYDSIGSPSSRVVGINDQFPSEKGEAMTAVSLLCRFFLGQDPGRNPVMTRHADLMLSSLPEWDPEGFGCDMYYWYYGSYAMFQMGGKHWKAWSKALDRAVVKSQRRDGDFEGSWDPVGPWGHSGGRVYSTALMVLCLQTYYRYGRVLGAR